MENNPLIFNKDETYVLRVCVSSKINTNSPKKSLFEERNVIFVGTEYQLKYKPLTFKRLYPKPGVTEHFHIKKEYIYDAEVQQAIPSI